MVAPPFGNAFLVLHVSEFSPVIPLPIMSSEIGLTIGAIELGILISAILYGVTTVQVYIYHKSFTRDSLLIRATIATIWTLETVHTCFSSMFLYRITVTYYGDPIALQFTHWTINSSAIFVGLIGTIVQVWSAYRIYQLSGGLLIPIVSCTGAAMRLTGSLSIFALTTPVVGFNEYEEKFDWIAIATLVLSVCVDALNAGTMSYLLWREKDGGLKRTNLLIDKLILWTMETGTITTLIAILMLVFFQIDSHKYVYWWASVSLFYAKVYSNSLLASFNARTTLRTKFMAPSTKMLTTIEMAVGTDDSEMSVRTSTTKQD